MKNLLTTIRLLERVNDKFFDVHKEKGELNFNSSTFEFILIQSEENFFNWRKFPFAPTKNRPVKFIYKYYFNIPLF